MKRILFVLLMLTGVAYANPKDTIPPTAAQKPPMKLNYEFRRTIFFDSGYVMISYADTASANTHWISRVPGSEIRVGNDRWMRSADTSAWLQFVNTGPGTTANIAPAKTFFGNLSTGTAEADFLPIQWYDSIRKSNDTLYASKRGVWIRVATGVGGGSTPSLQDVISQSGILTTTNDIDDSDGSHQLNIGKNTPFSQIVIGGPVEFQNDVTAPSVTADNVQVDSIKIGNSWFYTAEITIDSTQIVDDIYTTGIELIPSPGAGKAINVITATEYLTFSTAAYVASGSPANIISYSFGADGLRDNGTVFTMGSSNGGTYHDVNFTGTLFVENAPLILWNNDGFTDGNSLIKFYIYYQVITL